MEKIPLTQGKFAIVDDEDYEFLMQWKWHYQNVGYAIRVDYTDGRQIVSMAREVLNRIGFEDYDCADHVNRDRCDNRRLNLRPATNSESICNQGVRQTSKSGYKGVDLYGRTGRWRARIAARGRQINLGYYSTKEEAAKVYNEAAKKYHGKYAVLNEVQT